MTYSAAASKIKRFTQIVVIALLALASVRTYAAEAKSTPESGLAPILTYISSGWNTLTRSMTDCQTVVDPKLTEASAVPAGVISPHPRRCRTCRSDARYRCGLRPGVMTAPGQIDPSKIAPGLLYLENKYVVPGGRFNEMYGMGQLFHHSWIGPRRTS